MSANYWHNEKIKQDMKIIKNVVYEQWKQRLRRCVAAQGNYFEADNVDL
jgi:hypothetical protein